MIHWKPEERGKKNEAVPGEPGKMEYTNEFHLALNLLLQTILEPHDTQFYPF